MRSYQEFFAELKRRKVFRVAGVYGVTAFVLLQVADLLGQGLRLGDTFVPFITAVVLLGFPLALILAWAFEVTPDGVRKTAAAAAGEIEEIVAQPASQRWPAGLLALIGVAALVVGAWWVGTRTGSPPDPAATGSDPDARLAYRSLADDTRPSIAVLPFVNMSDERQQEYFSDGITEEILNVLAKVPELRVAARTSAFAFKGRQLDVRVVGDSLGVEYVIEGSVRKAGDQLRITAQLIDAADGSHLWSEQYDRTLDDVFAIQTEIAESIAEELRVPLGIEDRSNLVTATTDLEAYDLYLAARSHMRTRGENLRDARRLFGAAIARDPAFAPAWAGLAESLELTSWYAAAWDDAPTDSASYFSRRDSLWEASEEAARRALELDPNNASAHVALGSVLRNKRDWEASEAAFRRALSVDPDNPEAHQQYGEMLVNMGRIAEGRRAAVRAVALDRAPIRIVWDGFTLLVDGEAERGHEVLSAGYRDYPDLSYMRINLEWASAELGRWDEWVALAPDDSSREARRRLLAGDLSADISGAGGEVTAWLHIGQPDSALSVMTRIAVLFWPTVVWLPTFDSLRSDPAYLEMLRRVNLEGAVPRRTPKTDGASGD